MWGQLKNRMMNIKDHETKAVVLSFVYFFSLLGSYYVLRPIRDEMSMELGPKNLQDNFLAVFLTMLALVPIFGWITKKFSRTVVLPIVYIFFASNLLFFYCFFESVGAQTLWVARSFFVWVSVFNLFVISVFWSFMADLFTTEQSSRLNGIISAGGTLGALSGPLITAMLVESLGAKNLILVSMGFLLLAVFCVMILRHELRGQTSIKDSAEEIVPKRQNKSSSVEGFSGSIFSGLAEIVRSKYLLGICIFLICYALLSTFLYGMSTELLPRLYPDSVQRIKVLASMDFLVNILSLLGQFFLFGWIVKKFGRTVALLLVPLWSLLGFMVFAFLGNIQFLIVFGIIRRAGEFSISKPTRETLFNALPAEQKYRAKNVMDTLVHRTGDVTSSSLFSHLHNSGMAEQGFAILSSLLALGWVFNAIWLGRRSEELLIAAMASFPEGISEASIAPESQG